MDDINALFDEETPDVNSGLRNTILRSIAQHAGIQSAGVNERIQIIADLKAGKKGAKGNEKIIRGLDTAIDHLKNDYDQTSAVMSQEALMNSGDQTQAVAAPVAEAPVAEASAETEAPVAEASAETEAPVAEASAETEAPVAEASAETEAPVAEASAETEAPVAEASAETEAPVAEASAETEAPVAEASAETEAPVAEAKGFTLEEAREVLRKITPLKICLEDHGIDPESEFSLEAPKCLIPKLIAKLETRKGMKMADGEPELYQFLLSLKS